MSNKNDGCHLFVIEINAKVTFVIGYGPSCYRNLKKIKVGYKRTKVIEVYEKQQVIK